MKEFNDLIEKNLNRFQEFEYYIPLSNKAMRNCNIHPDITIETCKSLLEGVSKTIIESLSDDADLLKSVNKLDMSVLIKKSMKLLSEHDDDFELDLTRASASLAYSLGVLRNSRGDISHGRSVPKDNQSTVLLARTVLKISDGVLTYMLATFFGKINQVKNLLVYEDLEDFNNFLDEMYPIEGKPLYSRALFEQYYEDYEIQYSDYIDRIKEDDE